MDLARPWAAALVLWIVGAIAGRRIMIAYAELETLQSLWGTLSWVMPTKFILLLLVALVAAFLHGRRWHSRSPRHLLAVFAVPALVLVQDVVFLVLSEEPDYLFWTMRELATVAGAVCGWALASLVRSRSR